MTGYKPGDETLYRIEFQIQRREASDEDFTEVGFGSSGGWGTVNQAAHILGSMVDNREWETTAGMPDPDSVDKGGED
jgi:hypothetical protein